MWTTWSLPAPECIWHLMTEPLLCKLCTAEGHRRKGAGTAVMRACIAYAREHGASFITIASNRILHDALRMYAREGFREVPVTGPMYDRVDIQLRLDL